MRLRNLFSSAADWKTTYLSQKHIRFEARIKFRSQPTKTQKPQAPKLGGSIFPSTNFMHITSAARPGHNSNSFSKLSPDSSSPWLDEDAYTFEFVQFVLVLSKCQLPWAYPFKQDSYYFFVITSPNEMTGTESPTTLPINHCKRQITLNKRQCISPHLQWNYNCSTVCGNLRRARRRSWGLHRARAEDARFGQKQIWIASEDDKDMRRHRPR